MNSIIHKIDILHKELSSLLPMKPEYQQKLDKKFRLEFNYNSNNIEGNTLTYGETELLLIFGQTQGSHEYREYDEMKAHDAALEMIKDWATNKEKPLTEIDIKNLNRLLLVEPFWKEALTPDGQPTRRLIKIGEYKEQPNSVKLENGEMFEYASPMDTPIQMGELLQWFRTEEEKKELHPVELAALLHYKFVRIHPFDDGNGRISRLLVNYVLLRNNLPPIIIKSADKKNYLRALNLADIGDINAFVDYIADQELWSLDISIKAAKGESIDEAVDLDKKIASLKKQFNYDDVKIKRTKEVIIECYKNSIDPLLRIMHDKLGKLSGFFKNQTEELTFFDQNNKAFGSAKNLTQGLATITNSSFVTGRVVYDYVFSDPRGNKKGGMKFSLVLNIVFHQLVYEIKYFDADIAYDKLYHEVFTEVECNEIVEKIGNKFLEKLEQSIRADR